jgi:HSP20 family protein
MSQPIEVHNNGGAPAPAAKTLRRSVAPPVDVLENADEILLVADVPGVQTDAFEVSVERDTLTLETKRRPEPETRSLGREYEEVDYSRSFRIPAGIDVVHITAEVKQGTLAVRLPKIAAAKPRKVAVRAS